MDYKQSIWLEGVERWRSFRCTKLEKVRTGIIDRLPEAQERLKIFQSKFTEKYPFPDEAYRLGVAEALTQVLMEDILFLYAMDLNDSAIIHLHGIIEYFVVIQIKKNFITPKKSSTLLKNIDRFGFSQSTKILMDFGVIDGTTWNFLAELNKLRNAIVHKDIERIQKLLKSKKKDIWVIDTQSALSDMDCIPYILNSIDSLIEIWQFNLNSMKEKVEI